MNVTKVRLRVLVALVSLVIAYFVTAYAASFSGIPLGGGTEGTPVTVFVIFAVFPVTLIVLLVVGNLLINRYFRTRASS